VDLGLVAYPTRDPRLEIVQIRKDRLVVICHPQHALAGKKSLNVKALDGLRFINYERDIPTRKALDKIFKDRRVTVQQVMQFDNIETVKRAVEIDSGVAIVPQETIGEEVANGTLVAVELEKGAYTRPLGVIYKKNKVLSPAIKQFIGMLKEAP
jgi:DNA-binding transcriptional LysR family regulator